MHSTELISPSLEDSISDILRKAILGCEMSQTPISLSKEKLRTLQKDTNNEESLRTLALALHLEPERLLAISRQEYRPQVGNLPEGFLRFKTEFDDMEVNSYLAWDLTTHEAVAFDTGTDASQLFDSLTEHQLQLKLLLLTHSHIDHVFELDRIIEKTGAPAWTAEDLAGAQLFSPGKNFSLGSSLYIETRLTNGHSPTGITYVIQGLAPHPIAVVGDALFAGSIGNPNISYTDSLKTCASEILSLPDDTLLCPGHGPLTTVKQEKTSNPFF